MVFVGGCLLTYYLLSTLVNRTHCYKLNTMSLKQNFLITQILSAVSLVTLFVGGMIIYSLFMEAKLLSKQIGDYQRMVDDTFALEQEFFIDRSDELKQWSHEQFSDYSSVFHELSKSLPDYPIAHVYLAQIDDVMREFEQNFYQLLNYQEKIGFDENDGVLGRFKKSVDSLEANIVTLGLTEFQVAILEIRKAEQDYLLKNNQSYLNRHQQLVNNFELTISQKNIPESAQLRLLLTQYNQGVNQYIDLLNLQGVKANDGLRGKNNQLKQVATERMATLRSVLSEQVKQKLTIMLTIVLGLMLAIVCTAVLFSIKTTRRLATGVISILDVSRQIIDKSDFSLRVKQTSDDELGDLADNVNRVLSHVEELLNKLTHAQSRMIEDAKMASLGSMVKGFAHELNTPLGVAITSESYLKDALAKLKQDFEAGTLQKQTLEQILNDSESSLSLMEANLNRSANLIASFKQVASHQEYDELVEFKLIDFFNSLVTNLSHELNKYEVSVDLEIPEELVVHTFLGAFNQIFTILIINSLRHGIVDDKPLNINILAKSVSGAIHFRYTDDGAGIASDLIDKVFEPFVTTKRSQGGTGLGLSIVYNLVTQKLGGEVELQSIEGEGVCIYLHFNDLEHKLVFAD